MRISVWQNRQGDNVNIEDMSDQYLQNCIKFALRNPTVLMGGNSIVELAEEFQQRADRNNDWLAEQAIEADIESHEF